MLEKTSVATHFSTTRPAPPSAPGLPLVGSLLPVMKDPLAFFLTAQATYGDIYTLRLGPLEVIVLNHPRHVQHVLRDHVHNYSKGGPIWDTVRTLLGNGLVVSEGDFWRRQRRMMQPHFHRQRLASLTDHMVTAIDEELRNWETATQQPFDIAHAMMQISMRVFVKALFGGSLTPEQMNLVARKMTLVLKHLSVSTLTQALPAWLPVPGRRRYRQAVQAIDQVIFGVIEQRRSGSAGEDLLTLLLHMVDDESGEQMTAQQLRDEAVSMFVAGYETTAIALAWSFHFLTQQPAVYARLQSEVDQVLGGRPPTFADLPQLAYTRQVLQEALRYYPPVWQLTRTADEADEIDGYAIPAGKTVALMQNVIQHHPAIWLNPSQFDPDRFTPEQSATRPELAWWPFGAGQRQCIGRDFALMEGQLVLASVLQRYTLRALPGRIPTPQAVITLCPKAGVWVTLERR
ncbi:MAG TPA: cytochrome P450 [Caldilineaceae bacterium]|nr:cytochrome P450 [Caldilineaceae bacterium]